jgi:hypothetical protein
MIQQTQKLIKEIEVVSNDNLLLRATNQELEKSYGKLRNAFNELLDLHVELRTKVGLDINDDFTYEWVERAGLTDTEL